LEYVRELGTDYDFLEGRVREERGGSPALVSSPRHGLGPVPRPGNGEGIVEVKQKKMKRKDRPDELVQVEEEPETKKVKLTTDESLEGRILKDSEVEEKLSSIGKDFGAKLYKEAMAVRGTIEARERHEDEAIVKKAFVGMIGHFQIPREFGKVCGFWGFGCDGHGALEKIKGTTARQDMFVQLSKDYGVKVEWIHGKWGIPSGFRFEYINPDSDSNKK